MIRGSLRHEPRALLVDQSSAFRIALGSVHGGVGSEMDGDVRTSSVESLTNRRFIRDVKRRAIKGRDVELAGGHGVLVQERGGAAGGRYLACKDKAQVSSDLSPAPGDEHAQGAYFVSPPQLVSTTGARSSSGAHHASCSLYQRTVSAMPPANSMVGAQPSSVRILVVSSR